MCSGHAVTVLESYVSVLCTPGGEVWEADMEETGGGCGGPRRRQQLCSGPDNSKRAPWCVTIATLPYSISTSLVLDRVEDMRQVLGFFLSSLPTSSLLLGR